MLSWKKEAVVLKISHTSRDLSSQKTSTTGRLGDANFYILSTGSLKLFKPINEQLATLGLEDQENWNRQLSDLSSMTIINMPQKSTTWRGKLFGLISNYVAGLKSHVCRTTKESHYLTQEFFHACILRFLICYSKKRKI